jgi:hypothetical protein
MSERPVTIRNWQFLRVWKGVHDARTRAACAADVICKTGSA